jgi:predicted RNA-binding Zn ribbon-like protein
MPPISLAFYRVRLHTSVMVFDKQRGRLNAVTNRIPILIGARKGESGLPAGFMPPIQPPPLVRVFGDSDLEHVMQALREDERAHFLSVVGLLEALRKKNPHTLRQAVIKIKESLAQRRKSVRTPRLNQADRKNVESLHRGLSVLYGLDPGHEQEAKDIWDGVALSPREETDVRSLLSRQISNELHGVQFVLWWTGRYFTPALYCPYLPSALYVQALLKVIGKTKAFAVCPRCGNLFIQERTDQKYCSIAHREAHRVARWRARGKPAKKSRNQ